MSFHKDHPVIFGIGSTVCVCVTIVAVVFTMGNYSVQATKIKAEQEIKTTEIHEREETERVEEKSQFWQKLVPWGSDEEESSK